MPLKSPRPLALAVALASLSATALAEDNNGKLQINGFATAGVTMVDDVNGGDYNRDYFNESAITDEIDPSYDTVLGVQLTYQLTDKFDLVGQLVSDAKLDYDTSLEWGYVAYRLNDNIRLRAGRFAAPYFMVSESQRVGQAYPWVRPPIELYAGLPQRSLDGFDVQFRTSLTDAWSLEAQLYFGGANEAWGRSRNAHGLNLNLSSDSLTLHAGYGSSQLDWDFGADPNGTQVQQANYLLQQFGSPGYSTKDNKATFADVGFSFDNGSILITGEFGQFRTEGWAPDWDAGYLTVGAYVGKALPFISAAKANTMNNGDCVAHQNVAVNNANGAAFLLQGEITAHSLAISNAVAAQAAASAAADAALAANDMATYSAQLGLAAMQSALIASETAQATLKTVGLDQIQQQALPGLQNVVANCSGREQTSYSLGMRYDLTKSVSMKLQVDHVKNPDNSTGFVTDPTVNAPLEDFNVFSLNFNAAF
ncbi:MAG: hypothetical protein K0S16_1260 [Moraxellaceae bacterium]|jgi:hypothetical protein|nr:hypothetical protein [Moraxellaceae bacterium]